MSNPQTPISNEATGLSTDSKNEVKRLAERYQKGQDLKSAGVNPYPYKYNQTHHAKDILAKHHGLAPETHTGDIVSVAGRVVLLRSMGKAAFAHVQDETGKIQFYIRQDEVGDEIYQSLKKTDMGDIVGVSGEIFATKTGEISVHAKSFVLLAKAVRDLPDKYHGIKDPEIKYRYRYLDLISNQDVKDTFKKRSAIISATREFFAKKNVMEVETPLLQTQYGGANARPFVTHINAWDMKMYLSVSPELYLKRLIVGGFERVFTICKNFRNEGVDHSHNPEFTMLETYLAYADYNDMMELTEQLFEFVSMKVNGTTKATIYVREDNKEAKPLEVDFKAPWPRKSTAQLIKEILNIDIMSMDENALRHFCSSNKLTLPYDATWGACVKAIFDEFIEKKVIQPTHVIDRPVESSPLCKQHRNDERLIEQCEPIVAGMEIANMYSELNDPIRQKKLLEAQANQLRGGDDEAHPMDEDFVRAIEYGMPPTGGLGIGIDRMVMVLSGQSTIKDVILFPTTKPEIVEKPKDKKE